MSVQSMLMTLSIAAIGLASTQACGGEKVVEGTSAPPPSAAPGAPGAPGAPAGSVSALPPPIFTEADFTESEGSRDPFHSYERLFLPVQETRTVPQYTVILEKYSIDELRLAAIVKSSDGIRAMFVDPQGKGWIVQRGAHIGRGEIVRIGTSTSAYPLHWKIDRIKDDEVVLVREDALHPELQPTYREIPLHTESEKT